MQHRFSLKTMGVTLAIVLLLTGCAETKGSMAMLDPVDKSVELAAYQQLEIKAEAKDGVPIRDDEMERLVNTIKAKINEREDIRFSHVCTGCRLDSGLMMKLTVTRYEKGSAAARFFLAGLGQIHIDADITLVDIATGKELAKGHASKTFAWGGVYGGSTTIKDIEPAFAEAVVDILDQHSASRLGQQRDGSRREG